jgi:hypothetical protein
MQFGELGRRQAADGLRKVAAGGVPTAQEADAIRCLFHEATHSYSPRVPGVTYSGVGLVVEEVTTEVCARSALGKLIGSPTSMAVGSYQGYIDVVVDAIAKVGKMPRAQAFALLERVSLEMRRGGFPIARSPDDYLTNLAEALFPGDFGRYTDFEQAVKKAFP